MMNNGAATTDKAIIFVKYDPLDRIVCKGTVVKSTGFDALDADRAYDESQVTPHFENTVTDTACLLVVNMYDTLSVSGVFTGMNFNGGPLNNIKGRLAVTAFRNKSGESWSYKAYSYDHLGRVKNMWFKTGNSGWKSIVNSYDQLAQFQQQFDNELSIYKYDNQYRLKQLLGNSSQLYRKYDYNYANQITSDSLFQNNTTALGKVVYGYNPYSGWVTEINEQKENRFKEVLGYSSNGNITSQDIYQKNVSNVVETKNFSYYYDSVNRLTGAACTNNSAFSESYEYDNDGNLTKKTGNTKNYRYAYNTGKNTVLTVTDSGQSSLRYSFLYDINGNLKQKQESTLGAKLNIDEYDYRNLPLAVTTRNIVANSQPVTTYYGYDEQGQRITKKVGTGSVVNEYYLRDQSGRELGVYDMNTNLLKQVNIYGRSLEGRYDVRWDYVQVPVEEDIDPSGYITQLQKTVTGTYYYIKDHLGNIRQTVKRDATGSFAGQRNYYPYGAVMNETVVGGTTDRYQYTGKERDKETGLDYFGARYYDSDLGIWHSVDPMADKYPGWSPYNYCLGNPLGYTDPNGMWVPTRDSSGNIIVTSVDGDIYEDLYTQLGMTTEQFAAFAAKQGIKLSLDCSGMSFDITSIVLIQRKFSSDNLNMNCFSSSLYGSGAFSEEPHIYDGRIFTQFAQEKLGYKKISDA